MGSKMLPKRAQAGKPQDWEIIRLEYIHSSKTLAQVSREFGVSERAAQKRSERHGWAAQRRAAAEKVAQAAAAEIERRRLKSLVDWNEKDLQLAAGLRGRVASAVAASLKSPDGQLSPASIRQLAGAAESIQRIGRLALGATTDNQGVSAPDGGPVQTTEVTLDEYEAAMRRFIGML